MVKLPTLGKGKPNFVIDSVTVNVNTEHSERVIRKFFKNYFAITIVLMATAALKIEIF